MDTALWITIGLMVLVAAATAGLWARDRSLRHLIGGLGLLLIPLGMYFTGLMQLLYNGIVSLVDWFQRTWWSNTVAWGTGLIGAGIVLFFLSRLIRTRPREERHADVAPGRVESRKQAPPAVGSRPASQPPPATRVPPADKKNTKASDEDAEIEAILRKRGIT